MDFKNERLHGDLQQEVFMELAPEFALKDESARGVSGKRLLRAETVPLSLVQQIQSSNDETKLQKCHVDHTLFVKENGLEVTIFTVYVDKYYYYKK